MESREAEEPIQRKFGIEGKSVPKDVPMHRVKRIKSKRRGSGREEKRRERSRADRQNQKTGCK